MTASVHALFTLAASYPVSAFRLWASVAQVYWCGHRRTQRGVTVMLATVPGARETAAIRPQASIKA